VIDWPEQVEGLLGAVRSLAQREVAPHATRWDDEGRIDEGLAARLGSELGLIGIGVDEADGGSGVGMLGAVAVLEELAGTSGGLAAALAIHEGAGLGLASHAEPDRREAVLQAWLLARTPGTWVGARHGIACTADGAGWRLRGRAPMIPGAAGQGPTAVIATGADGPTAFLLPADALLQRRPRAALGLRCAAWGELGIDLRLDDDARIGPRGGAASLAALAHARTSVLLAAVASGLARAALVHAAAYARERVQFGHPIAQFQAIQWKLADGGTGRDAGFVLATRAAGQLDRGERGAAAAAAQAHLLSVRHAIAACSDALQIHGGYGYTREYPIERLLRDARACTAADRPEQELRGDLATAIATRFA